MDSIRPQVQNVESGVFDCSDLRWEFSSKQAQKVEGGSVDAKIAYIPWARVEDFIEGLFYYISCVTIDHPLCNITNHNCFPITMHCLIMVVSMVQAIQLMRSLNRLNVKLHCNCNCR